MDKGDFYEPIALEGLRCAEYGVAVRYDEGDSEVGT